MGTRHLTAVHVGGKYKVAQYGQWDGYPSGQGATVLEFCREMDREAFAAKCTAATEISADELTALWKSFGADDSGFVSFAIADKLKAAYPQFSRDTGADVLNIIAEHEPGIQLDLGLNFAADSLFCEWAYVVDLDKGTLEVFKGFNNEPLDASERFHFLDKDGQEYRPVRKVAAFDLSALPSDEEFLQACDPETEEEVQEA